MSNPVSFFYRRDRRPAETYTFTLKVDASNDAFHFFVCANARLKKYQVKDDKLRKPEQHQGAIGELQKALAEKGGLFVVLSQVEKKWTVQFHNVDGEINGLAPRTFLEVELGRSPRIRQIEDDVQEVPEGCHLVVPVDSASEEQLASFKDNLGWFPEDLEAVVLCALVRPSLDERVSRLEDRILKRIPLARKGATGGRRRLSGDLDGWWLLIPKPVWIGALVLLAVWGFLSLRARWEGSGDKEEGMSAATTTPGASETATAVATEQEAVQPEPSEPENPTQKEFADSLGRVLEAVESSGMRLPAFKHFYENHFLSYSKSTDRKRDLATTLGGRGQDEVLLGLIKLQVIQLNRKTQDFRFLTRAANLDQTEDAAKQINKSTREAGGPAQNMIATLSCIMWKQPALGATMFGARGRTCPQYNLSDALPGLKSLPEFLTTFTPAKRDGLARTTSNTAEVMEPPPLTEPPSPGAEPSPTGTPPGGSQQ